MASSGSHCGNSVDITTDFSSRTEETPSIPTQENSLMLVSIVASFQNLISNFYVS